MAVSELSNEGNGVHAGIFSQGIGDDLEGFSERLDNVAVGTGDLASVDLELLADFHLNGCSSRDKSPSLDEGTNHAEGVVEGALSLINH